MASETCGLEEEAHDRLTSRYLFKVLVPTEVSANQTRPRSHPEQRLQPRHGSDHNGLDSRLVVSRNETSFFFGGKRRGEHSNWRQRAGKDHHAAESGYAAAEILFEMLAQLLGDGGVRLTGQ